MKKGYKTSLIILGILIAAGLIWFFVIRKKEMPLVLPTEKPTYGYIAESVTATGTIQPVDTVTVGTQVSGTISVLNADFNSKVKKGQLLAQLDKSLLQAVVDQNKANVQNQKSQLLYNQGVFARQKQLFETGAISRQDYESALNNLKVSQANVANAEAQLRSSLKNLSYTEIYSPIDGVVLSRNISIGQTVAASFSTPTLFVIAKDITKMQVQAKVDEADIGNVAKGQRASFTVDAYIEDSFQGKVADVRLHPSVSANVVTYTTIINAPNDDMKLKPGMTANINVYTKEVSHALLISSKALNFSPDSTLTKKYRLQPWSKTAAKASGFEGNTAKRNDSVNKVTAKPAYVWLKKGDTLVQTPVKVGLDDNTHAEILQGLSENDLVVSSMPVQSATAPPASTSIIPRPPSNNKKK